MLTPAQRNALIGVTLLLVLVATATAALVLVLRTPITPPPQTVQRSEPPFPTDDIARADVKAVRNPPMAVPDQLPPPDAGVGTDERVIGVRVNGQYRAYALMAFSDVGFHVVNDLIAGRPVSVSFCPRTGCTRVFIGPAGRRLSLAVGGWSKKEGEEQMLLRIDRRLFFQSTAESVSGGPALPYSPLEYELTTWGEWHRKHPTTDLYSGGAEVSY